MTTSRMRRHTPFGPTDPNICTWDGVADIINCAKFLENRFRGPGAGRPWKMAFPTETVHRPYNSRLWCTVRQYTVGYPSNSLASSHTPDGDIQAQPCAVWPRTSPYWTRLVNHFCQFRWRLRWSLVMCLCGQCSCWPFAWLFYAPEMPEVVCAVVSTPFDDRFHYLFIIHGGVNRIPVSGSLSIGCRHGVAGDRSCLFLYCPRRLRFTVRLSKLYGPRKYVCIVHFTARLLDMLPAACINLSNTDRLLMTIVSDVS